MLLSPLLQVIPESPYLIEPLIDGFEEETSQLVRLELLSAATKLFFSRPAEMQHMLGRLLDAAISDASFTNVHDRAMMYYRLLQYDVHEACRVLTKSSVVTGPFVEEAPSELQVPRQCCTIAVLPSTDLLILPCVPDQPWSPTHFVGIALFASPLPTSRTLATLL